MKEIKKIEVQGTQYNISDLLLRGAFGGDIQSVEWTYTSNINNYVNAGLFRIKGERTGDTDNLPILNVGSGHTIDGMLYVLDSSINESEVCVTQVLMLSNRVGGDGHIFIRTGNATSKNDLLNGNGWGTWAKQQGIFEKTQINDATEIDGYTTNGMYSGVVANEGVVGSLKIAQGSTILLITINGYAAVPNDAIPAQCTQLLYVLPLGYDATQGKASLQKAHLYLRTGIWVSDSFNWADWLKIDDVSGGSGSTEDIFNGEQVNSLKDADVFAVKSGEEIHTVSVGVMKQTFGSGQGGGTTGSVEIVNDLTTGGAYKALSAEMGKELNGKVSELSIEIDTIRPLSDYELHRGFLNVTSLEDMDGYYYIIIPIDKEGTITLTNTNQTYLYFTKSIPSVGQSIEFTGKYNQRVSISGSSSATKLAFESDTKYCILQVITNSGNRTPSSFILNGYELATGIHEKVVDLYTNKQNKLEIGVNFDSTPVSQSLNPISSGAVYSIAEKIGDADFGSKSDTLTPISYVVGDRVNSFTTGSTIKVSHDIANWATAIFNVVEGLTYHLKSYRTQSTMNYYFTFVDANDIVIYKVPLPSGESSWFEVEVIAPTNSAKVYISTYTSVSSEITAIQRSSSTISDAIKALQGLEGKVTINQWAGKTILFYGDSVTYLGQSTDGGAVMSGEATYPYDIPADSYNWQKYVCQFLKFSKFYTRGIGGAKWEHMDTVSYINTETGALIGNSTVIGDVVIKNNTYQFDDYENAPEVPGCTRVHSGLSDWDRIEASIPTSIANDIDVVFMFCHNSLVDDLTVSYLESGAPDVAWVGSPSNTFGGDYDTSDSANAIISTIQKFHARCPNAVIIVGTPISGEGAGDGSSTTNLNSDMSGLTRAANTKKCAEIMASPCINVFGTDGINSTNRSEYISDMVHPFKYKGGVAIARAIIGGLIGIVPIKFL